MRRLGGKDLCIINMGSLMMYHASFKLGGLKVRLKLNPSMENIGGTCSYSKITCVYVLENG